MITLSQVRRGSPKSLIEAIKFIENLPPMYVEDADIYSEPKVLRKFEFVSRQKECSITVWDAEHGHFQLTNWMNNEGENRLEAMYQCVVSFLNWYNKNK